MKTAKTAEEFYTERNGGKPPKQSLKDGEYISPVYACSLMQSYHASQLEEGTMIIRNFLCSCWKVKRMITRKSYHEMVEYLKIKKIETFKPSVSGKEDKGMSESEKVWRDACIPELNHNEKFISFVKNHDDGVTITIMERNGYGMGVLSIYNDLPNDGDKVGMISQINTDEGQRRKGLANDILHNLEEIGSNMGIINFQLATEKGWKVGWYKRRGYVQYSEYEDTNYVGMEKTIIIEKTLNPAG